VRVIEYWPVAVELEVEMASVVEPEPPAIGLLVGDPVASEGSPVALMITLPVNPLSGMI